MTQRVCTKSNCYKLAVQQTHTKPVGAHPVNRDTQNGFIHGNRARPASLDWKLRCRSFGPGLVRFCRVTAENGETHQNLHKHVCVVSLAGSAGHKVDGLPLARTGDWLGFWLTIFYHNVVRCRLLTGDAVNLYYHFGTPPGQTEVTDPVSFSKF